MEPEPSGSTLIGTSEMGSITPCPPPSIAEGAEALSASTMSESAALRITIPSSDSSRRKQWKAQPTAIQAPPNPSNFPAPLPTKRPRGKPRGSTTKRKDVLSAPIASRKVDLRVNAVASSSAVTLDALDGHQHAWRIISPAPRDSGTPDPSACEPLCPSASAPLDPPACSSARRRADPRKRKAEAVPTDDAPRKRRREAPAATSTASEDGPRWLPPRLGPTRTMPSAQDGLTCAAELRPRIWASNKADLHVVLPELFGTKPTNTPISTMVDYMPVIVLDEESIQVAVDKANPLCCKLTISRKFSCDGAALPQPAPGGLNATNLPQIPSTLCTERRSDPELMTEKSQANDADIPGTEHTSEHLTSIAVQLEDQDSPGAPEAETVRGPAVLQDSPDEGEKLKHAPLMPTGLPIGPLKYAPEILTALWHFALSDSQSLDVRVLDEVEPRGDLTIEHPPCQMEPVSIPEMHLPKNLPPDVDALQEAWIQQYPVLLVASRATLAAIWRVLVPDEYAYCFLGLFHLTGMQDKITRSPDCEPLTTVDGRGLTSANVQWAMTLRWMGGGERFPGNEDLQRPWWVPTCLQQLHTPAPTPTTIDESVEMPSATPMPQQLGPSTNGADDPPLNSMAAMARTWLSYLSPAAMMVFPGDCDSDTSLFEDDRGVYPSSFVPRVGQCLSDDTFPSGWCCRRCGRINLQLCMRRRACASTVCATMCTELKEERAASPDLAPADQVPAYVGYALRLDDVRDPRDTLPLAQPVSVYPNGVQSFMAEAEDGMRIVEVRESRQVPVKELGGAVPSALAKAIASEKDELTVVDEAMDVDESVSRVGTLLATHIFTCNMRSLQSDADQLFLDVQRHADLQRTRVSDHIFRCELPVARVPPSEGDDQVPFDEEVTTSEGLARRLHDHLVDRAYGYTDEELEIPPRRLLCIAGIGAGSRKLPDTLNATNHPVIVLCLGCDARLTVFKRKLDAAKSSKVKVEDEDDAEEAQQAKGADAGKNTADLSVGMVHGDVLVLRNDVYQISFKRTGTSIIIIGCP